MLPGAVLNAQRAPNIRQVGLIALGNAQAAAASSGDLSSSIPRFTRKTQALDYVFEHDHLLDRIEAEINDLLENIESRVSPSSKKKRASSKAFWFRLVQKYEPNLPENRAWDEDIVMKYYERLLPILVSVTKGTKGRDKMKSSTLQQHKELFVWNIARHARDAQGNRCGSLLLAKGGVLSRLDDQAFTLVNRYKLDRKQDLKLYYTELELNLFIQECMKMSQKTGRLVALQKICIVLTIFFTSVRPGTLGPSHKEYEIQEKFPKLRALKIFCLASMTFRVELTLDNFKGNNNTMTALSRRYIFQPVVQWSNVHLDLSMYFVAFLLARGALEGVSSVQDLRNYNLFELKVKDSFLDKPLFLAMKAGGRQFTPDERPLSAHGITHAIGVITQNAGMARGTAYCFRRGAANDYEILLGKDFSEQLLTHTTTGSLHFYSENTANIDVVGARLNELPVPMDANKQYMLSNKAATSRAVQAVIYLLESKKFQELHGREKGELQGREKGEVSNQESSFDDSFKAPRNKRSSVISLSKEQKLECVTGDEEYRRVLADLEQKWENFCACFPPAMFHRKGTKKEYKMAQSNIATIKRECRHFTENDGDNALAQAESELRAAFKAHSVLGIRLRRKFKDKIAKNEISSRATSNKGTIEEVNDAIQDIALRNPILVKEPDFTNIRDLDGGPRTFADISQSLTNHSVLKTAQITRPLPGTPASVIPFTPLSERIGETARVSGPGSASVLQSLPIAGPSKISRPSIAPPIPPVFPPFASENGTASTSPSSTTVSSGSAGPSSTTVSSGPVTPSLDAFLTDLAMDWNEQEQEESDEEPDVELTAMNQKLRNITAKIREPVTDPSEPVVEPCGIADTESKVTDKDSPNTAEVRSEYMEILISPIVIEGAFNSLRPMPNGKYQCPRCVQHFHHRPDLQSANYSSSEHVWRHVTTQHTAWKELVLLMIKEGSSRYHCPCAPDCAFIGDSEQEVLKHCTEDCKEQAGFKRILKQHQSIVEDNRAVAQGSVKPTAYKEYADSIFRHQEETGMRLQKWLEILRDMHPNAYSTTTKDIEVVTAQKWSASESTPANYEDASGLSYDELVQQYNL